MIMCTSLMVEVIVMAEAKAAVQLMIMAMLCN
jgi:hypothetical protein